MSYKQQNNKRPAQAMGNSGRSHNKKPFDQKSKPQGKNGGYQGKSNGRPMKPFPQNKGKGKAKESYNGDDNKAIKRKQPVTRYQDEDDQEKSDYSGEDDDDMMGNENGDGNGNGNGVEGEIGYADPYSYVPNDIQPKLDAEGNVIKKQRLSKEEKKELMLNQPHRNTLTNGYKLLVEVLPLWEKARQTATEVGDGTGISRQERSEAVKELYGLVKGRIGELGRGHKGGRVLQTIVKYGGKEERLGVAEELRRQWRTLMESKYSKFLMSKLIRYCPSIRPLLIQDLRPALPSLLNHAEAVGPLSDLFDLYATSKEKKLLVRGFYPKEVLVFDNSASDTSPKSLEEILENMGDGGAGRSRVLDGIERNVLGPFKNTQKTALAQAIFHRLVLEYLNCVYRFLDAETADKKMHELLTDALESLPDIIHTKDGSSVVRLLLVRGNAKDRKQILQPLRKHLPAISKDSEAQLVLFTALDVVDDTKLMGKAFVNDLIALISSKPEPSFNGTKAGKNDGETFLSNINARRSILYLLVPESTKHFLPATVKDLRESSEMAKSLGTSKKDMVIRRKEIVGYASGGLLEKIRENTEGWVRDPSLGLMVQEIMLHTTGDKSSTVQSLLTPLSTPFPSEPASQPDPQSAHLLELSHCVRTYKTLLSGGHFNYNTRSIQVIDPSLPPMLASGLWKAISSEEAGGDENVVNVACGAPFVIIEMMAALNEQEREEVKGTLCVDEAKRRIKESEAKGVDLLLEKLA